MTEPVLHRQSGAEKAATVGGRTVAGGSDWRARLETSCDNSDLSETEQQIISQLPSGYFYDPEECVIVRNSPDLPECVELVTALGQRISVPTAGVVLGLTEGCA